MMNHLMNEHMDTRIKHIPSGAVYANRREAKRELGHGRYNRALRNGELLFVSMYKPLDIII